MNVEDLKSRVLPVLLIGTRRDVLDDHISQLGNDREHAVLNSLSLAGQLLRFTRSAAPKEYAVEAWPRDERLIVPGSLRAPILRLLDKCTEDTARALALALEKQKLRPHPFDLPNLDGFIRRYADRLGVTAQYWVQRETAAHSRGFFDDDELTAETWTDRPLRLRIRFLRDLRISDPAAARVLLEKGWHSENPDSRVQLISILQKGLSAEDKNFLEGLRKDRAPRVRAIVLRLLAAISGSSSDNPAVAACMDRIQKTKAGLLKKHEALKLELPATVKEQNASRWIQEQFADVTVDEMARAFEMTHADLIEASAKDENLLFALSLMASREGRLDLLATIADELPDAWGRMSELGLEEGADEPGERARWAEALIRPKEWLPEMPFPAWSWLHRQMEGPLPASVMSEVLRATAWTAQLEPEKKGGTEIVQVMCALCPRELRESLRAQIEPLDTERKDKGWMLLEILDTLEKLK